MTQLVQGIHLPDGDMHFRHHLESTDANPIIDGKGTYQYQKIRLGLDMVSVERHRHAMDVGGHVGLWSRVLAQHFQFVSAFEPIPEHIECFRLNLANVQHVRLYDFALGNYNGDIRLAREIEISGNSHVDEAGDVTTRVRTLDSFWEQGEFAFPVDFLKVDVEGFEQFVLRGGEKMIRHDKPIMVIEQKGAKSGHREAIDLLESWGAKVKWVKAGDFGLVWE